MNPANAIACCGAECGLAATGTASAGQEHIAAAVGSPTVVTSGPSPMRSTRCWQMNPSAASEYIGIGWTTAPASAAPVVVRFAIWFVSLPSADTMILAFQGQPTYGIRFKQATSTLVARASSEGGTPFTVTTGQWYVIDVSWKTSSNPTMNARVNGTALGQASTVSASLTPGNPLVGIIDATTADVYIDDVLASSSSADYPLGDSTIVGLYPNADGTHVYNAGGDFGDGASAGSNLAVPSSGQTDTWQSLANPLSTSIATNYVGAIAADTTLTGDRPAEFLRFGFDNLPGAASSVNAVNVIAAVHASSATTNNHRIHVDDGSSTPPAVLINADLSETTITIPHAMATVAGDSAAWSVSKVNSTFLRFSSSDVNPDAFLDGLCIEVDIPVSGDATATPSATAVTTTRDAPSGGAGGIETQAVATATMNLAQGLIGAVATPSATTPTVALLVPSGGAGGVPPATAVVATALTPTQPNATATPSATAVTAMLLTPGGGATAVPPPQVVLNAGEQYARTFSAASSEKIDLSLGGGGSLSGAFSIAAIVRRTADGATQQILNVGNVATTTKRFAINNTGVLSLRSNNVTVGGTATVTAADGWVLVAASKAAGTATPRFHIYKFSTGVWTHEDAIGTLGDSTPSGSSAIGYQNATSVNYFTGDIAIVGARAGTTSDAEAEGLLALTQWTTWLTIGLWRLNQSSVGTSVTDSTGNGANQSAITGTTATFVAPSPWLQGLVPTGNVGGSPAATTPTVTRNVPLGSAGGVAGNHLVTVVMLQPTGVTSGGGATATPSATTPTVTLLAPGGGAGGGITAVAPLTAFNNANGTAGGTANALTPIVVRNAPGGGAGGGAAVATPTVTRNAPGGGAGGVAGDLVATVTRNAPGGGAGGVAGGLVVTVVMLQPPSGGGASGSPSPFVAAVALLTPGGGAGGVHTTVSRGVTFGAPGGGAGGGITAAAPLTAFNNPNGTAGGVSAALTPIVVRNAPGGGAGGSGSVVAALTTRLTPAGGAGGVAGGLLVTVTMLTPPSGGGSSGLPAVFAASTAFPTPGGGAGGVHTTVGHGASFNAPGGAAGGTSTAFSPLTAVNNPAGTVSSTVAAVAALTVFPQASALVESRGIGIPTQVVVVFPTPIGHAGGVAGGLLVVVVFPTPTGVALLPGLLHPSIADAWVTTSSAHAGHDLVSSAAVSSGRSAAEAWEG